MTLPALLPDADREWRRFRRQHGDRLCVRFGATLLSRMSRRGLTRDRFASLVGVNPREVCRWVTSRAFPGARIREQDDLWIQAVGCTFYDLLREALT